jgi:predicted membrane protein
MSQLARMFVVLNFLLAAGFLYAAAMFLGLNHEYKKKNEALSVQMTREHDEAQKREKDQKGRIDDLTKESQTLKENGSGLQATNAQLKDQNDKLTAQLKEKDAIIAKEQGNVASAQDGMKRANDELAKRTEEANKLRTDAATAQGSERKANEDLEKAKTEIRNRDNTIGELEKTKTDMTAKIDELEIVKKIAQDAKVDLSQVINSAPIPDAKVIGYDADMKLVQVNAGSTQKVARGTTLDIVRGSSYIGRIKIDQVYPNSAAGTLFIAAPGQTVQVGDRATNTIN